MAAPEGNSFWKMRTKHGRDAMFDDAEKLREACCEYFQWTEDNPLWEDKVGFYEGAATHTDTAKMRAMTISGLCLYLGIGPDTWRDWRGKRDDLTAVIRWADEVIKTQKFQGAAAGLLNANIIARDLGLSDKQLIQNLDENGNPMRTTPASGVEIIDKYMSDIGRALLLDAERQREREALKAPDKPLPALLKP